MNEIKAIPLSDIRPFDGQPRKYFDPVALQELADSIVEVGQRTPAWVMEKKPGKFMLIAGERRWRACALAGIPTLRCEVRPTENADAQYVDSVLENFGRKDCTVMETAHAIQKVAEIFCGPNPKFGQENLKKIGRIFTRGPAWVAQHRSLLNLHPKVQAMLDPALPQAKRLHTQVAIALANLLHEDQVNIASSILEKGMRFKPALEYVRNSKTSTNRAVNKGKVRRPDDDFRIFSRFLNNLGENAQIMLHIPHDRLTGMFANRPPAVLKTVIAVLRKRSTQLESLAARLEKATQ